MIKVALFLAHGGDPMTAAIKALERRSHSHAALLLDEAEGRIFELFYPEARFRNLKPEERVAIDLYEIIGLTPEQQTKILAVCQGAVTYHQRYGVANLFRFLPFARPILGEAKDDADLNAHKAPLFCSQAVFDALKYAGIQLLNAHSWEVAPENLAWSTLLRKVDWAPVAAA